MSKKLTKSMRLEIIASLILTLSVTTAVGLVLKHTSANTANVKQVAKTPSATSSSPSAASSADPDKETILNMLAGQGLDKNKLASEYKSQSGATILGGAMPAIRYKSLADAEKAYGDYLGLHNKLDSLVEYSLVDIHIINKEFMEASYETQDAKKSIIVKTSKVKKAADLIKVYGTLDYNLKVTIQDIDVNIAGTGIDKIQLMSFDTSDGKSYSIHTDYGLSAVDANKLLTELINNVQLIKEQS